MVSAVLLSLSSFGALSKAVSPLSSTIDLFKMIVSKSWVAVRWISAEFVLEVYLVSVCLEVFCDLASSSYVFQKVIYA